MSRVWRSLQFHAPGELTSSEPPASRACQTRNTAPSGSAKTAIRPASPKSSGASSVLPPAASTLATTASASSTAM